MKTGKENIRRARERMVDLQLVARDIRDHRVLEAMRTVPRHLFVEDPEQDYAYEDHPIPIGHKQTISQPYIVAFMTEALKVEQHHTVLEIGTGSGYQTAILSILAKQVISLETVPELAETAAERLRDLGFLNIEVHCADGYEGWRWEAPYERILGTAAPRKLPQTLMDQLTRGGRMVLPIGYLITGQHLKIFTKKDNGKLEAEVSLPVRFVPMVRL